MTTHISQIIDRILGPALSKGEVRKPSKPTKRRNLTLEELAKKHGVNA